MELVVCIWQLEYWRTNQIIRIPECKVKAPINLPESTSGLFL